MCASRYINTYEQKNCVHSFKGSNPELLQQISMLYENTFREARSEYYKVRTSELYNVCEHLGIQSETSRRCNE